MTLSPVLVAMKLWFAQALTGTPGPGAAWPCSDGLVMLTFVDACAPRFRSGLRFAPYESRPDRSHTAESGEPLKGAFAMREVA